MSRPVDPDFRPLYHQLHRVGRPGIWRSLLGVLSIVVLMMLVVPAAAGLVLFVALIVSGDSVAEATATLDITQNVTPIGLALVNVVIGLAIPVVWGVTWLFHRLKPRWVASVAPRIRWRYLWVCLVLSVVALMASFAVALLLPTVESGAPLGEVNDFTARTRAFLLVIVLLTPFQAAGEEYVFRGYFTQAFGSMVPHEAVSKGLAVLAPALLFALAHGAQSVPVFFDRFAFGVVAGILVLITGGLEAGIAMHVLNNFFAFGLALAFGDMTETLNASGPASWWMIASTLTQSLVYLGLATWAARAMGLVNRGPAVGSVLEPSQARV